MKEITSIKEFCKEQNTNYVLKVTPYEFYLLKKSLANQIYDIEFEMQAFDWENTKENKELLTALKSLYEDLQNIPF